MTVKELKEKLATFSNDSIVLVQGYEGGFSEIGLLKESKVKLNVYDESWNGPHEEDQDAVVSAVLLIRQANANSKE